MTFQSASLTNQGYSLLERQIVAARMKPRASFALLMLVLLAGSCPSADAAMLRVGRQRTYKTPCAAIAAAVPGDVIEIDAALYRGIRGQRMEIGLASGCQAAASETTAAPVGDDEAVVATRRLQQSSH